MLSYFLLSTSFPYMDDIWRRRNYTPPCCKFGIQCWLENNDGSKKNVEQLCSLFSEVSLLDRGDENMVDVPKGFSMGESRSHHRIDSDGDILMADCDRCPIPNQHAINSRTHCFICPYFTVDFLLETCLVNNMNASN